MSRIVFNVSVQFENENDPETTPIEDALFEWTEESSPPIPVAELVFEPQKITKARKEYGDTLSFNPWNYHPDHRPLGNLARGRLFSYAESRKGRGAEETPGFEDFLATWNSL